MDATNLSGELYHLYETGGQYAVYDYATKHPDKFESKWTYCEPCDNDTPTIKGDDSCAVCGSAKATATLTKDERPA
jgi:hypothetical protein